MGGEESEQDRKDGKKQRLEREKRRETHVVKG
jgi:hypothetical protein